MHPSDGGAPDGDTPDPGDLEGREPTAEERAELERLLLNDPPPDLIEAFRQWAMPEVLAATAADAVVEAMSDEEREQFNETVRGEYLDELVAGLTSFVCFVGYSRSGGSIVAALMDAHPNLVVAHEHDVFVHDGGEVTAALAYPDRVSLVHEMIRDANGVRPERRGQRVRPDGSRYYSSYLVEGGWQGRCVEPRAVGTKNAVESARVAHRFGAEPFHALQEQAGVPLRFLHVVRDPYDNIATMKRVHGDRSIIRYRNRADGVAAIKAGSFEVLDVHLDDLIDDPRRELVRICELYGVDPTEDYLAGCAALVADRPSRTATETVWEPGERASIDRLIEDVPWLHRYRGRHA